MYALSDKYSRSSMTGAVSNFVLRYSRRLVRSAGFFLSRDLKVPRFFGVGVFVGFFSVVSIYGVFTGGHSLRVAQAVTSSFGFSVEAVDVLGNQYMSDVDIVTALNLREHASILGFDVNKARETLSSLPWVHAAEVQKIYPDRVIVTVIEREPFAVWQHGDKFDVVDKDGRVIVPYTGNKFGGLPQIVGSGAAETAAHFVAKFAQYPEVAAQVRAYIRVGNRRWDLVLLNGLRIKLPEFDVDQRLAEIAKLERESGIFNRDIREVDARLDDRITFALTSSALDRYKKKVEEEERQLRALKGGRA